MFTLMFVGSFMLHAIAGLGAHNEERMIDRLPPETLSEYVLGPEFWFESLQNWQSEFLAIFLMVVLTIFLRQRGSSQSKPVHTPHWQTGKE